MKWKDLFINSFSSSSDISSKRMTAFWFVVLTTVLQLFMAYLAYINCGGKIDVMIRYLADLDTSNKIFISIFFGLTTIENIITIFKLIRGVKETKDEKPTDNSAGDPK